MSADELDVDAELLGMVGDDSSDDEGSDSGEMLNRNQQIEDRTPSEEPKVSVEKVEEPPSVRRGVAQKVRKRGGRKRVNKRELEDELNDLGDDSSSSPARSRGSDAMPESAAPSPAPASPLDEGPMFPVEGRFYSSTDRAEILALPEIEREAILADRAIKALERQQDLELRKAFATSHAAASKNKRKAAAAQLDDNDGGARKSSRAKPEKTGRSALDDYKKAREAKGAERTSRFDAKPARKRGSRSRSSASGGDADGESEVEWADSTATRHDEVPAGLRDFERCRVGRSNFAKVCFYPNFESTMKGCFCRVSIGVNRETGQNMYRMTQIKNFKPGKPYALELPSGKTFMTDQYAVVAHGASEKPWPFSACSDSTLTESEFQRYIETLQKEQQRIPQKAWLQQKLDDIHKFLNVDWTDEVLQGKFARQREMAKRVDPANAAKMKKENILRRKKEAEDAGDIEEMNRCEAELVRQENNAATNGTFTTASKHASQLKSKPLAVPNSQQERLALLNQKNRGKNADDVKKALLEERRKLHRERERAQADAKAKAEAAAAEKARLRALEKEAAAGGLLGVPNMKELFGDMSDFSRAGTPVSGVSTPRLRRSRQGTPINGIGGEKKKSALGLGAGAKKQAQEDELGGLDLGIDVEI